MSEKYLDDNGTQILINQIKENCTQKRSTLPIPSIDELGNTYQYTGTTSGSLVHGYFYECVVASENPTTYSWQQVNTQPTAGTPTASGTTFDNTTSGLQATNVQDAVDEVEGRVDNIEGKIPSTATSSNKLIDHDSLGTAAFKDSTDRVSPNNTALVESQSVYSAINTALSSIYTPRGDITCTELTSDLLIAANVGNIYETSDSGTTTALFLQGAGVPIATGSNVGIISAGQGRILFNLMANAFDLTSYQKKDLTQSVEGQTTVEGALGVLSTNKQAKTLTNSVESQTTVEGALGALSTNKATQAEVNDIVNVLSAKNFVPYPYQQVKSSNGITWTDNGDGSVTANGTATENSWIVFTASTANPVEIPKSIKELVGKEVIMSSGEYQTGIGIRIDFYDAQLTELFHADTSTIATRKFTIPSDSAYMAFQAFVLSGITASNVTIYPMIRLASDPDNTYVPYAMTNQQITPYVQAISNPNLLDNPWFTVNQRGNGTISSENGYITDRWTYVNAPTSGGTSVTSENGIRFYGQTDNRFLIQKIPANEIALLVGKTLTATILFSDGTIYKGTQVLKDSGQTTYFNNTSFYIYSIASKNEIFGIGVKAGVDITVRAVKLELGSVSTLAMDTAPNYATELEKCKRFFEKNSWVSWIPCKAITNGSMMYGFTYRFDVQKRIANWNMVVDSTKGNSNGFLYDLTTGTTIPNAEIVISNSGSYNSRMVQIKITHSSIVAGHEYRYAIGDNVFEISADL